MSANKILVVEDEGIVAFDIQCRLTRLGYQVVATSDTAEKAIAGADEYHPDLILMDIKLKGAMDGIQAAEIIREKMDIPIIFLTANADEATIQRAKIVHAFGYILKPFEERELATNIEMALYKHETEIKLKENQAYLQAIFQSVPDGIFIFDEAGNCIDANPAGVQLLGYTCEELQQAGLTAHFQLEGNRAGAGLTAAKQGKELRLITKQGSEIWTELTTSPLVRNGQPCVMGILHDITARKSMEISLRASEERYMLASLGANDGLWDWDIPNRRIYVSARCKDMLDYEEDHFFESPAKWLELIHPDDLNRVKTDIDIHLRGLSAFFQNEHRLRNRHGHYRWMLMRGLAVRGPDQTAYRMAGSLTDITERVQFTQRLEYDAFHDPLTRLPNRALFLDRLSQALERTRRTPPYHYAVLFMDLDHFKKVNDQLGHAAGDQLLIDISQRLKQILRSCDTLARLGGDEFVALIEDANGPADGVLVAERFLQQFQTPFDLNGIPVWISASIGIVAESSQYEGAEKILRDADIAMYQAKSEGKARYALFSGTYNAGLIP